jgi:hypothetical protein
MATGSGPQIAVVKDWVGVSPPFIARIDTPRSVMTPAVMTPAIMVPRRWPAGRIAAVETLWGEGFNGPGGAAEVLRLAAPIGLTADHTLLLVGGGLGGPARAIAQGSGARVASYEADGEVVAIARQRAGAWAESERIVVHGWSPSYPDFGSRIADHAMLLEGLRGAEPVQTLDSLACSLKPGARIVITEMVADRPMPEKDREFAAWCRLENRAPVLPRGEAITGALTRLHYDVRVVEDISASHVSAALAGWRQAMQAIGEGPVPNTAAASMVVTEAELWLLRIRVMRRFGLRVLRWHAVGSGGGKTHAT